MEPCQDAPGPSLRPRRYTQDRDRRRRVILWWSSLVAPRSVKLTEYGRAYSPRQACQLPPPLILLRLNSIAGITNKNRTTARALARPVCIPSVKPL